jgi:hypothetical protein
LQSSAAGNDDHLEPTDDDNSAPAAASDGVHNDNID